MNNSPIVNTSTKPSVHKKAKKNSYVMPIIIITIAVGFLSLILGQKIHLAKVAATASGTPIDWASAIDLGGIASVFIAILALVWQIYNIISINNTYVIEPKLNITQTAGLVHFSCDLINKGKRVLYPYLVNLYIDEGKYDADSRAFTFDRMLDHTVDYNNNSAFNCHLSEHCQKRTLDEPTTFPPCIDARYKDMLRYSYNIRSLSYHSLIHILPNEEFTEDMVVHIEKPSVYRATLIYTDLKWNDCICIAEKFIVGDKKHKYQ